MNIVEFETNDIPVFKTVTEILSTIVENADAEFIKDFEKYDKEEEEDNNSDSDNDNNSDNDSDNNSDYDSGEESDNCDTKIIKNNNKDNKGGIKIVTMDEAGMMMVVIKLKGSGFTKFNVMPDVYKAGLNFEELNKYIKATDKNGTMNVSIDSDDTQKIIFNVKSNNSDKVSICELNIINSEETSAKKLEVDVSMAVRISCSDFHKACKDLSAFDQNIEITCYPTQLTIKCKSDTSRQARIFTASNNDDEDDNNDDKIHNNSVKIRVIDNDGNESKKKKKKPKIISLIFNIKYINNLLKCTNLCNDMEIYMKEDKPMIMRYGIKNIGEMFAAISPSKPKQLDDSDIDDSDSDFTDSDFSDESDSDESQYHSDDNINYIE
jgi:proliferating cell nuclear antigen PCNA